MWPFILSDRLLIVALVGRYPAQPANQTRAHPVPPEFFTPEDVFLCAYAVLAAISGCYPPCTGQVTHALSPVRHSVTKDHPKDLLRRFVRLACVRHAASVHPEPGSNSQKKYIMSVQPQEPLVLSCFTVCFRFELRSLPWILLPTSLASGPEISIELNVRGCFVIQLSTFFTELRSALLLLNCKSFYILSHLLVFVKHFFLFVFNQDSKENVFSKTHFFTSLIDVKKSIYGRLFFSKPLLSQATLTFYHMTFLLSSTFYSLLCFCQKKQKRIRRRRDLNPRTA